jgi:serine O-acetyltransferase
MSGWPATRRAMAADRAALAAHLDAGGAREALWLQPAHVAVRLYRLSHYLHAAGWRRAARLLWFAGIALTGADLDPAAEIGPGVLIPSPHSVTIRGRIGAGCRLGAQVGIGWRMPEGCQDLPVLADGVEVGPGTLILGPVRVGARARIGPRCLVTADVPEDARVSPLDWRGVKL